MRHVLFSVVTTATLALLAGCGVEPSPGPQVQAQRYKIPANAQPVAKTVSADPKVAARQHIFGFENVDPATGAVRADRVILSWFSVSSLAASLGGRVVLLDSYIHLRSEEPGVVPTTLQELNDLAPEAIFIGHWHFDHGEGSGIVAAQTGAVAVGTPEHCAQMKTEADTVLGPGSGEDVNCLEVVSAGSAPGTEIVELDLLGPDVCITALKHLHSAAEDTDPDFPSNQAMLQPDPGSPLNHPPGPPVVIAPGSAAGDEGYSMFYQFRLGEFALTWHDTAGPLKENHPEIFEIYRDLPHTDVQVGAIWGANYTANGTRDVVMYIEALEPRIFYPLHHDLVGGWGTSDDYRDAMLLDMRWIPQERWPDIRWLYEPIDYVRPELMSFDIASPQWRGGPAGRPSGGCG